MGSVLAFSWGVGFERETLVWIGSATSVVRLIIWRGGRSGLELSSFSVILRLVLVELGVLVMRLSCSGYLDKELNVIMCYF